MNSQPLIDTASSLVGSGRGLLEGLILKSNMVLPGLTCPYQETVNGVAAATVQCLHEVVPAPYGIAFLSGGQSGELASARLNAMHSENQSGPPLFCHSPSVTSAR
jgi:fructose-bisphosphate aldolase, class I